MARTNEEIDTVLDRVKGDLDPLRSPTGGWVVPDEGTVADQRTLTSSSTASEVRAALITAVRDCIRKGFFTGKIG